MIISIIGAKTKNNVIGLNNSLIWHLPNDLKYFKAKTLGHFILMGRKTYQSLGTQLIDRKIIVVTRAKDFMENGCVIVNSIDAGLKYAKDKGESEIFVCGGEQIYKQTINIANRLYLTHINCKLEGDSYFPDFQKKDWKIFNKINFKKDKKHKYSFEIIEYERNVN